MDCGFEPAATQKGFLTYTHLAIDVFALTVRLVVTEDARAGSTQVSAPRADRR